MRCRNFLFVDWMHFLISSIHFWNLKLLFFSRKFLSESSLINSDPTQISLTQYPSNEISSLYLWKYNERNSLWLLNSFPLKNSAKRESFWPAKESYTIQCLCILHLLNEFLLQTLIKFESCLEVKTQIFWFQVNSSEELQLYWSNKWDSNYGLLIFKSVSKYKCFKEAGFDHLRSKVYFSMNFLLFKLIWEYLDHDPLQFIKLFQFNYRTTFQYDWGVINYFLFHIHWVLTWS